MAFFLKKYGPSQKMSSQKSRFCKRIPAFLVRNSLLEALHSLTLVFKQKSWSFFMPKAGEKKSKEKKIRDRNPNYVRTGC